MAAALHDKLSSEAFPSGARVDDFVAEVTNAIKFKREALTNGLDRINKRNAKGRKSSKRKGYATTQELFKKAPAELAELVRNNRLNGHLQTNEADPP